MKSSNYVFAAFFSVYVFWGSTYLAIRLVLEAGLPPLLGAGMRMLTAGAVLAGLMGYRAMPQPPPRLWPSLLVAGGLLFVGGHGLVVLAETRISSGLTAILVATTPLWMSGFEALVPGSGRVSPLAIAGICLGLFGIVVLIDADIHSATFLGAMLGLLAPVFWSLGSLWAKYRLRRLAHLAVTAYEMLFGGLLLLLAGILRGEPLHFQASLVGWLALAYLIVFGSLLGFSAFTYLMVHVPAAKVSTYAYVNPVIAVFLGWVWFDEPVGWRTFFGAGIVLLAVILVNSSRVPGALPAKMPKEAAE